MKTFLYDAIIGGCAKKAKAEVICTWNVKQFRRLGASINDYRIKIEHPEA